MGASVALKVFSGEKVSSRFLRERFEAEGRILARLKHPRLVRVFESGIDAASGSPYYAMSLVRDANGRPTTLHDVCGSGKVTEARAERWYADLRDVLDYCHRCGVVHRDVKIGNVLLDADDHAVLADLDATSRHRHLAVAKRRPCANADMGIVIPQGNVARPGDVRANLHASTASVKRDIDSCPP